jgi:hypothetical protein
MKKTYVVYNTILDEIVYVGSSYEPKERYKQHIRVAKQIKKLIVENIDDRSKIHPIHYHMYEFGVENFRMEIVSNFNIEGELQRKLNPKYNIRTERIMEFSTVSTDKII